MKANDKETEETEVNKEDDPNPPTIDVNINDNSDDEKNYYEVTHNTPINGIKMKQLKTRRQEL